MRKPKKLEAIELSLLELHWMTIFAVVAISFISMLGGHYIWRVIVN